MIVCATNCAALPISLAFLESGCLSRDTRSTTASIAELKSSTITANKQTAIITACSMRVTSRKKVIGIKITLIKTICRNAASCW